MRRRVPVERFPVEVTANTSGLLVMRHDATGYVEHITVSPGRKVPRGPFEADQCRRTGVWTIFGTKRGWTVERWEVERWVEVEPDGPE